MQISRRSFLLSSAVGAVGATTPLYAMAPAKPAKNLIVIYLIGGASQIDLWDPKPDAPTDYRGPISSIATTLCDVRVSEVLPRMATLMDRCVLIRSMNSQIDDVFGHSSAIHECLTGSRHLPAQDSSGNRATFAAGIAAELSERHVRSHVQLGFDQPLLRPYWSAGRRDDDAQTDRVVGTTEKRSSFERNCRNAHDMVDGGFKIVEIAWDIMIDGEMSWDTHLGVEQATRLSAGILDQGLSRLIQDLERSHLLGDTIVAVTTEFGRHPLIGVSNTGNDTSTLGRDHGRNHFSALLVGGGLPQGVVIGDTGPDGLSRSDDEVSPAKLITLLKSAMHGAPDLCHA